MLMKLIEPRMTKTGFRESILGRLIKDHKKSVTASIKTHCIDKWLFVDLEDGYIYSPVFDGGWRLPTAAQIKELKAVIKSERY